jgi:hypothetical protein
MWCLEPFGTEKSPSYLEHPPLFVSPGGENSPKTKNTACELQVCLTLRTGNFFDDYISLRNFSIISLSKIHILFAIQ